MKKSLIIVESPTKIKALKQFLGDKFIFESSLGHIRDLPEKEFGIEIENEFEPKYAILPGKKEILSKIQKAVKECETVYLSPDPDREGEAIAWHIRQLLPSNVEVKRVAFNSITKEAVQEALKNPREVDMALVNAQQARRLLDRIVGYKISPILNRRLQRGRDKSVSAGRVQSVALKLVVDREKEIEAFKPVEYWNILAVLSPLSPYKEFQAFLYSIEGKKLEKELIEGKSTCILPNELSAQAIVERMHHLSYRVQRVEKKEKRRNPEAPFITSTLQQEASRHFGFSASRTMKIAQSLYEGIDLGSEGVEGLITYMRTDSVRVVPEAIQELRTYIQNHYGQPFLPDRPRTFSSKKSAQDAHEAIRPTHLQHSPERVKSYLTKEQAQLYTLIWKRFLASQMTQAVYDTISADIAGDESILLRSTGSILKFPGFLSVYEEKVDEEESEEQKSLPALEEGELLKLIELKPEQSFTRPPPRYSEASLVKELEKLGIGRPSTYAAIMNKIQNRDFTNKEAGRLKPTDLGKVTAQFLEVNFPQVMNVGFTADMEENLELVAENRKDWKKIIADFWGDFAPILETAEKEAFVPRIETDIACPKCDGHLIKIWFKSKYFYGCSNYPTCDYSGPIEEMSLNKEDYAADFDWEQKCPICHSDMKVRFGRYGTFLGCTCYPKCKGVVKIPKKGDVSLLQEKIACPAVGCEGHLVAKRSRWGKTFYSCSEFPGCNVIGNSTEEMVLKYENVPKTAYIGKTKKNKTEAKELPASAQKTKKKTSSKTTVKKRVTSIEAPKVARSQPQVKLSDALAELTGKKQLSRGELIKHLWSYIKEHQLQDPEDKRKIIPDSKLASLFETQERIGMFELPKLLQKHILKE